VPLAITAPKDPIKQAAGRAGARARWEGDRRTVRLGELTPEQRRLVLALVAAAKAEKGGGS
jgi:hypothetical protein